MIHIERSNRFVTVVPNDIVSVPCEKAVLFDAFVYTSTSKCLGINLKSASNEHTWPPIKTGCLLLDVHIPSNGE